MLEQQEQKSTELSGGQSRQCHLTPWMGSTPQRSHCAQTQRHETLGEKVSVQLPGQRWFSM